MTEGAGKRMDADVGRAGPRLPESEERGGRRRSPARLLRPNRGRALSPAHGTTSSTGDTGSRGGDGEAPAGLLLEHLPDLPLEGGDLLVDGVLQLPGGGRAGW